MRVCAGQIQRFIPGIAPALLELVAIVSLCAMPSAVAARDADFSSVARTDFWVPDGPVRAIAETNGVIYIGGKFDYVSPVAETGNAFDVDSGAALAGFPPFAGSIKSIINDGSGGWFVGGQFISAGGLSVTNLAHIFPDRTLDAAWAPNPDNAVLVLATDGTRLFVGGAFQNIAGQPRALVAAFDMSLVGLPAGGTSNRGLLDWRADCATPYPKASVNAMAVSGGRLYIAGYFRSINGEFREHLGSVEIATNQVTPWHPNGFNGAEAGSRIDALAISGNTVYVGGTFGSIGGSETNGPRRHGLAAFDISVPDAGSLLPWDPDADGPVSAIVVSCDAVYVGGAFTQVGGQPRSRIAALDGISGLAQPWNPGANEAVLSLALPGDQLYCGGKFTQIGGEPRSFLAALDTATGRVSAWKPKADFGIAGLAVSGSAIVTGGALGPGGQPRKNAAAFDARTGKPLAWAPQVGGGTLNSGGLAEGVYALAATRNTIYLGGPFTEINGQQRDHIAAVNAISGALTNWNPGVNGMVETLAVSGSLVYVGGLFSAAAGMPRTNVAAISTVAGRAARWNPGANDKVKVIFRQGSAVYAGGLFTDIGGKPRRRLAMLSAGSGKAGKWDPEVGDQVSALVPWKSMVCFGGVFSSVGGAPLEYLAAVSRKDGSVTCWAPEIAAGPDGEQAGAVNAVAVLNHTIYAGGTFDTVNGQARHSLAALDADCPATTLDWNPDIDNSVNAIMANKRLLAVGGAFQRVGGMYRPNLALFARTGAPIVLTNPASQIVNVGDVALLHAAASGDAPLTYQWLHDGSNIAGANTDTLVIPSAGVADSGEYMLVVTNRTGQIGSRPATLIVAQPIRIITQPQDQVVSPGSTITLSVGVTGNPAPSFQWRLNGINIPGATEATLTIPGAQPVDGGTYEVVAANNAQAITSDPATVVVMSPALDFADDIAARGTIAGISGVGSGSNVGATSEPGEPLHVGIRGGASVWVGWTAPAAGVATFSTRGSDFDTLLAVYRSVDMTLNAQLSALNFSGIRQVAADEDSGGFYTSTVSFNAEPGTEYLVAVDGFAGATGNITLRWNLDTDPTRFGYPIVALQPASQVVTNGGTATFVVEVDSRTPPTFQWYFGCDPIPGADQSTLTIGNVQPANVGDYHVVIQNASGLAAQSFDAALEIEVGGQDVLTRDKIEDPVPGAQLSSIGFRQHTPRILSSSPFISVSVGSIGAQLFSNNRAGATRGEPNHCQVSGGASRYLDFHAVNDGLVTIDAIGSRVDTVIAVYYRTNIFALSANRVACTPDGVRGSVQFCAEAGRDYRAFVDGVRGARGRMTLNWQMAAPTNCPVAR